MKTGLAVAVILASEFASAAPAGPEIITTDVTRFYEVYDAANGHPTEEQIDRDYLERGTQGLHEFAKLRRATGARNTDTLAKHPETCSNARRCLAVLPGVKQRLTVAFAKLAALYPAATFPPVHIVVGRGKPVGITNPSGVTMGLEALCAADFMDPDPEDRFVHTIARRCEKFS